jgi:hypothetical protein
MTDTLTENTRVGIVYDELAVFRAYKEATLTACQKTRETFQFPELGLGTL